MKLEFNRAILKYHILIWFLFIFYELSVVGARSKQFPNLYYEFSHYIVHAGFFYLFAHIILPWLLSVKRLKLLFIILVMPAFLGIYILTNFFLDKALIGLNLINVNRSFNFNMDVLFANLYRCVYVLGFATGYYFFSSYLSSRKREELLQKENLNKILEKAEYDRQLVIAQNAYLKAQINPHFLFNTLNFLHNQVSDKLPLAGEAIIRLSEMMRFALDSHQFDKEIALAEEIEQVENLLFLSSIRQESNFNVLLQCEEEVKAIKIIPMVLLTLVENIIKHGDISDPNNPATLRIYRDVNCLIIESQNLIKVNFTKFYSSKSGLKNLTERLFYEYKEEFVLNQIIDGNSFKVIIKVPVVIEDDLLVKCKSRLSLVSI